MAGAAFGNCSGGQAWQETRYGRLPKEAIEHMHDLGGLGAEINWLYGHGATRTSRRSDGSPTHPALK